MKNVKHGMDRSWLVPVIALIIVLGMALFVRAQEQKTQEQKAQDQQQQMVELWKKYAFPGENHKHLAYFVGDWDSVQKIFPRDGSEPVMQKQQIHVESLFDGRFTKAHIKVEAPGNPNAPEGIVITGFDNYQGKVISVTFGNLSTDFSLLSGTLENNGKTRIDTGTRTDIFTGEEYKVRAVTTIIDQDSYKYEYYKSDAAGNERRTMEIMYTRRKG